MNEYQQVTDGLRERRKGKPGELQMMLGLVLAIGAPFAAYLSSEDARMLEALKANGAVAEATVFDRDDRTERYTDRKGRPKTRQVYTLSLRHDLNREVSYSEWKASGKFPLAKYPALATSSLDVGQGEYDAMLIGHKTEIIRDPSDPAGARLVQRVEEETAFGHLAAIYAAAAAGSLAGLTCMIFGWRKRFGRA